MLLYHVRNQPTPNGVQWILEEPFRDLSTGPTPSTLTFTAVAKITDLARLQQVIRNVPVDAHAAWQTFNCRTWVEHALRAIAQDGGRMFWETGGRCWSSSVIPLRIRLGRCELLDKSFRLRDQFRIWSVRGRKYSARKGFKMADCIIGISEKYPLAK